MYVRANLYDALQQLPDAPGLQLKRWYTFEGERERVTDLQAAAADGDVALVKYVHTRYLFYCWLTHARTNLFRGASINVKDSAGRTALTFAVIKGHGPVVCCLNLAYLTC